MFLNHGLIYAQKKLNENNIGCGEEMACSWAGAETGDEKADVPVWARDDDDSGRGLCERKHESGMT